MQYTIDYYSDAVQAEVMGLPAALAARCIALPGRMLLQLHQKDRQDSRRGHGIDS